MLPHDTPAHSQLTTAFPNSVRIAPCEALRRDIVVNAGLASFIAVHPLQVRSCQYHLR
jgi:hypothetical protein